MKTAYISIVLVFLALLLCGCESTIPYKIVREGTVRSIWTPDGHFYSIVFESNHGVESFEYESVSVPPLWQGLNCRITLYTNDFSFSRCIVYKKIVVERIQ
jgi:hypothetical protein